MRFKLRDFKYVWDQNLKILFIVLIKEIDFIRLSVREEKDIYYLCFLNKLFSGYYIILLMVFAKVNPCYWLFKFLNVIPFFKYRIKSYNKLTILYCLK